MIGTTVGKYRIVGQLGRGGAGIVYKAVDQTLNREVAIKTLNPDLANTEVMKRFRAEATILARLNHPQIATIYELFRSDTDLLMVMEFVRGETLDKVLERLGPLPPDSAAYLIDQVLSALEHAHREGVVHRDMKPANVMVTEAGGVKIMDFGIARVRGVEQMTQMTQDGRLMGTPAYMPPEQVLGQEVDGRADLYAVGVVFYRLLTGALPFTAENPLAMLQRQILETPLPLHLHRADLPEWCNAIVQRSLAKSPTERFQTAEAFKEDLARATGLLPTAEIAKALAVPPVAPTTTDTLDLSNLDDGDEPRVSSTLVSETTLWRKGSAWAPSMLAVVAVSAALLAYLTLRRPAAETAMAAPAPQVSVPEPVAIETTPQGEVPASGEDAPTAPAALPAEVSTTAPVEDGRPDEHEETVEDAERSRVLARRFAAPLVFETRALVGARKPREHNAHLVLANGMITLNPDGDPTYPLYAIPYRSVISITYSRGRDPMWNSPQGPTPVTRGGGTLGRLGIVVARDWIALRTNTKDQFVAMRFDTVLVRRVLLALEERTGRKPQLIAEPKDEK